MAALGCDKFTDLARNHTLEALAAVVGCDVEIVRHTAHLILVDEHRGGLGSDDHIDRHAMLVQPLHLRIYGRRAHTSSNEEITPAAQLIHRHVDKLRRVAQRPRQIGQGVALVQGAHLARRHAYGLYDYCYRTGRSVVIGYGQRHAFAVLVGADYHELSGQGAVRNARRLDTQSVDVLRKQFLLYDLEHISSYITFGINVSHQTLPASGHRLRVSPLTAPRRWPSRAASASGAPGRS